MNTDRLPRLGLIAGPTASGKTALALAWAAREPATIVNADASQVYRDLRILSARPTPDEEAQAPHRLFGHRDGAAACSAAEWAGEARTALAEAWAAERLPILVGGTGLYLRTLLDGIAPVPPIDVAVRTAVRALPVEEAHRALAREDPAVAARLHPHDTTRVHRALEVRRATGRSIADWQVERQGGIRGQVALERVLTDLPVTELYARCDARVDVMLAAGALDEVEALLARGLDPALPVMRAIGVPELARVARQECDLATAASAIKQATRRFAKRQRTWFRHQPL